MAERVAERRRLELAVFSAKGLAVHPVTPGKTLVVGRGQDVDIPVDDDAVSRRHAVFHPGPPLEVEDLGSANGTFVSAASTGAGRGAASPTADQSRVRVTRTQLGPGDTVFFGSALVTVRAVPEPAGASVLEGFDAIVREPALMRVYEEAARAAALTLPVLVLGETGVGKDVLARFIHHRSKRAGKPFVPLNCAALSESIAESELFGHERGAFTGAVQARAGILESASGGTVFLDEIGDLPLGTQAKLLRTLESSEVQRLGSVRPITIDARLVSATNRDIERDAATGRFRQDLYFRINGISLRVPPLRERTSEIPELARRFLANASRQAGLPAPPVLTDEAVAALVAHAWPGNVRELRYVMERTLVSAGQGPVRPEHLTGLGVDARPPSGREDPASRERVVQALVECDGNQTRAAERLGVSRRTLINRMIEFGLPRPRKDS